MGASLSVLLVDDDPLFTRALSRELTASGASVSLAHDLPSARGQLSSCDFDLMVLDFRLQDADGPALLETWPGDKALPVTIVLSGVVGIRETVRAMRAGALDVLKKPASASQILTCYQGATSVEVSSSHGTAPGRLDQLVGTHPTIEAARESIAELASAPAEPVTVLGQTGTGKALIARLLHHASTPAGSFVSVNCAAPEHLLESEIFGVTRESGALDPGQLLRARGGTLFLSDVGSVPRRLQARMLEVLETLARSGQASGLPRVVCATEPASLHDGSLDPELKRRLTTHVIMLPPLRERREDIEALANYFLVSFAARHPGAPRRLTQGAVRGLLSHPWRGNVRELKGVMQHCAAVCDSPELPASIVQAVLLYRTSAAPSASGTRPAVNFRGSLPELERDAIVQAFRASGNNVSEAARLVGLPRSTVRDKLKRYGIR